MVQGYFELERLDSAEAMLEAGRSLPHKAALDPLFDRFEDRLRQLRDPKLRDPVRIEGAAVVLRDAVPDDLEAMVRWWTTELAWTDWDAPWEPIPTDEAKIRASFEQQIARAPDLPRSRLMIALPDDTPVGRVNLYRLRDEPGEEESDQDRIALGINLHESPLWGKGLGTEAFALWTDYVFREHDRDTLYCETWSGNERMLRVAERLGFEVIRRRENLRKVRGERYDALRFAVKREAFRSSVVELGILPAE
jgi:RimJ/RimL family protein N-acetyltransferase